MELNGYFFFLFKVSFAESDLQVTFCLVIDELKVKRTLNISKRFCLEPKNGLVTAKVVAEQSIHFAVQVGPTVGKSTSATTQPQNEKLYRFEIKRLPSQIVPDKTRIKYEKGKVTITLQKKINEPWRSFADSDFETYHLVKS